jgi:hypothetical protein
MISVKRPSFDITGAQTYVRACKMQQVVPSSKLTKQLSQRGNTALNLPYYGLAEKGTMALSIAMLVGIIFNYKHWPICKHSNKHLKSMIKKKSVYRRRTENTMIKRKNTKGQTTINKTYK